MAQSYKTIRRGTFPVLHCRILVLGLLLFPVLGFAQQPKKADNRQAQIFPYYEYHFMVPANQADALWEFLLKNYAKSNEANNSESIIEEETLTDLYFDTPQKALLRQNLALRQRLFISNEGIKKHVELVLPAAKDSLWGYAANFRHNKRPDKGTAFTSHPVLKLLRTKDRPILDSLLKPFQVQTSQLETALEINQDLRRIPVLKNRNAWLVLTLTYLQVQAPDHKRIQLQIQADPAAIKNANLAERQQLIKAIDELAQKFKTEFPELEPEKRSEYALMAQLQKSPAKQKVSTKLIFGLSFLALIVAVLLYRNFRKKPIQSIE